MKIIDIKDNIKNNIRNVNPKKLPNSGGKGKMSIKKFMSSLIFGIIVITKATNIPPNMPPKKVIMYCNSTSSRFIKFSSK